MDYLSAVVPSLAQQAKEYSELHAVIEKHGLLDRQPAYYIPKIIITFAFLFLSLYGIVFFRHNLMLETLNILFLGFVFVQIGGLGHDAGHQEIFSDPFPNYLLGLLFMGISLGTSNSWWVDKHNLHHANPNTEDMDPDIDFPVVAFTEKQALEKHGFQRFMVKHQTFFYPFLVLLVPLNMRFHSIRILVQNKAKHRATEALCMLTYFLVMFTLLFTSLPVWQAITLFILNQMFVGFHISFIFAPNHKGMPMIRKGTKIGFLYQQILTSRNVQGHPLTDFLYLGLNYQIEHHLFPNMPRNNLCKAKKYVVAFCKQRHISYYETPAWQSYKELFAHLWTVSRILYSLPTPSFS
jgi:fatty acid desaturase